MGRYSNIFNQNRHEIAAAADKSRTWFYRQVSDLRGQSPNAASLIRSNYNRNATIVVPGELYLFRYQAKYADSLPVWDQFPMVFPFRKTKEGFVGLNLHYLGYPMRIALLEKLNDYRTHGQLNEHTRLQFSWDTIRSTSRLKIAENCVHQYRYDHIMSRMKIIHSQDWVTALLLPVENFISKG